MFEEEGYDGDVGPFFDVMVCITIALGVVLIALSIYVLNLGRDDSFLMFLYSFVSGIVLVNIGVFGRWIIRRGHIKSRAISFE